MKIREVIGTSGFGTTDLLVPNFITKKLTSFPPETGSAVRAFGEAG